MRIEVTLRKLKVFVGGNDDPAMCGGCEADSNGEDRGSEAVNGTSPRYHR